MTIIKSAFSWITLCLTLLFLTLSTAHLYVLKTTIDHQAHSQLQQSLRTLESWLTLPDHVNLLRADSSSLTTIFTTQLRHTPGLSAELRLSAHAETPLHWVSRTDTVVTAQPWFTTVADFQPLTVRESLIYQGNPLGELIFTLSPETREQLLWQEAVSFFIVAGGCSLMLMFLIFIVLNHKLRSITTIAAQANLVMNNQFKSLLPLPGDGEGRTIARMLNHLAGQLESNFKLQAKEAVKLKEQAYRDNVSGLGNRHYFINQINTWLAESAKGGLLLLKSKLIDDIYRHRGFTEGDEFVRKLAESINSNIIHSEITLARLSYDEFAVLAPNITSDKLTIIGETLLGVHQELQTASGSESPDSVHIGLLMATHPGNASQLLAQLDNVLAQAARNPDHPLTLANDNEHPIAFGKLQWKNLLLEAIDNDGIQYQYQPVANENKGIYHYEVFSAIQKGQQRYAAGQFLGAIEDVGSGVVFDRHVIAYHINRLNADSTLGPLAINITTNSVSDPAFIRWLSQILERNQRLASRLFFEIPETSFVRTPDACSLLCSAIRFYKFRFGVDNYGRYFKSLDYLTEFRPDYVKIDFSYTHQLNDQQKINLLSSISRTAHSLNILTIATRVETETQLDRLSDLFVSGFQGYIIETRQKQSRLNQTIRAPLPSY